ncbi:MAG: hypothetical protein QGF21_06560 [Vicinamibacterales bacterium]|nr:hypothetical protein [Acidobacteriota bacterium]MDP7472708.1 hypothetical protein [Vicinamibacterales bacterium]MDP7671588.1 hypothetical protein [Vicinamibacterales bacterium]HJO38590.1 hypothetical protein [Vicinamibacterales bacterium]
MSLVFLAFEVDGYPATAGCVGYYFAGQAIRLSLVEERADFVEWWVNGRPVGSEELWHLVGADTVIRPVFGRD